LLYVLDCKRLSDTGEFKKMIAYRDRDIIESKQGEESEVELAEDGPAPLSSEDGKVVWL
jgi:hypothetical protein